MLDKETNEVEEKTETLNKQDDKFIEFLKDIIKTIVIYVAVAFIITQFIVRPFRVDGESMYPALHDREVGFSNIIGLKISGVKRFDTVIVYIEETQKYLVKRVIGLPGERVEYENDVLYINGLPVAEPFLVEAYVSSETDNHTIDFTPDFGPVILGSEQYFLLGDNRLKSSDSRVYGPFDASQIKSKNGVIIYPFDKIRTLGGDPQ